MTLVLLSGGGRGAPIVVFEKPSVFRVRTDWSDAADEAAPTREELPSVNDKAAVSGGGEAEARRYDLVLQVLLMAPSSEPSRVTKGDGIGVSSAGSCNKEKQKECAHARAKTVDTASVEGWLRVLVPPSRNWTAAVITGAMACQKLCSTIHG